MVLQMFYGEMKSKGCMCFDFHRKKIFVLLVVLCLATWTKVWNTSLYLHLNRSVVEENAIIRASGNLLIKAQAETKENLVIRMKNFSCLLRYLDNAIMHLHVSFKSGCKNRKVCSYQSGKGLSGQRRSQHFCSSSISP